MPKPSDQTPPSSSQTLQKVLPFLKPFRFKILALILTTAVLSIISMLPPLFTRAIINDVIGKGQRNILLGLGIAIFLVPLLHAAISFFQVIGIAYIGQTFVLDVRMAVYRHLMRLHMGFFSTHSTGKLLNRIMGDSSNMQQVLNVTSIQVVSDLICSLFAIGATLWINWRLALPILLVVALFVVNYRFNISRIRTAWHRFMNSSDRLASGVQNRLVANLTVKTYAAEDREGAIFDTQSNTTTEQAHNAWIASTNFQNNTQLLQEIGRVTIYFLGCAMVLNGSADYGDVTAFTTYAMQILWPAVRFSQLAEQLQSVKISSDRLFEILDEEPKVVDRPNAKRIGRVQGKVDFDHIQFEYEEGRPIIREFDLHVEPGQTVALVGPTGCGKSTILSLLMRLYDVCGGAVRIDGHDIRDITTNSLRGQFGIVLQESLLFTVSVADNIRYARPDATQEEIENAARIAEIHDEILKLPHGYNSVIGNRDVQLSVGQKQRLSIARAVLADPAIIIMDEATSSLDSRSELAIQRAMERFLVNRTSFIVAHRLSTIRDADKIVLLDKGVIVECGNHEELMAIEGGRYRDLYEKHSGKGVLSEGEEDA